MAFSDYLRPTTLAPTGSVSALLADQKLTRRVALAACIVSCALVAVDLWANRDLFDADGMSYIDMADAYRRGDWRAALVGLWSPMYPWLLALMMLLFDPSPQWEFTAVHALDFVIYLATLASFGVFMSAFLRARAQTQPDTRLPDWAWVVFGYSLFTWSIIRLIPPHQPYPDLLVCAWVYLIFALLLRIRAGNVTWPAAILLGVLLAAGYLTKGIMFPMAFVFGAVALVLARGQRRRIAAAFLVFAALALPYIVLLSEANGRWSFNDAGRLNYAWEVNLVKPYSHWQGDAAHGTPLHPTRKINDDPPVYEFATPFAKATYPPWYNPSYWYEGVKLSLDLPKEISVFVQNSGYLASFLANAPGSVTEGHDAYNFLAERYEKSIGAFLALLCVIALTSLGRVSLTREIARHGFLLTPIAAVVAAYATLHFEGRYLAAYIVVLWMVLFRSAASAVSEDSKRTCVAVLASAALITVFSVAVGTYRATLDAARDYASGHAEAPLLQSGYTNWKVAKYLHDAGLHAGDPVAGVGWTYSAYWARMARVHIVAEVPLEGWATFWALDPFARGRVMQLFRATGAKAVVAFQFSGELTAPPAGWKRIGDTRYFVYLLNSPA